MVPVLWWELLSWSHLYLFKVRILIINVIEVSCYVIITTNSAAWVGKQFGRLRVETAGKTDKRIRLMSEIVNGMKVIKMYCWEKPFAHLVHDSRE